MKVFTTLAVIVLLQACKHPLQIIGRGDIVDLNGSVHGCTFEQFKAKDVACTENETFTDYHVNYRAVPRLGWKFAGWEGPCGHLSEPPNCRIDAEAAWVTLWDAEFGDVPIPPTVAVFERVDIGGY